MGGAAKDAGGGVRAWLQLVRAPNLFTAPVDVLVGWWLSHDRVDSPVELALLIFASCSIYAAGMALNDYFDVEQDSAERPHRPIPSGRISRRAAGRFGALLLVLGVLAAAAAAGVSNHAAPLVIAVLLAGCVVAYDGPSKRTLFGPPLMGACRGLNLLLGASTAAQEMSHPHVLAAAAGMAVYIAGVTWFARREAGRISRAGLAVGFGVLTAGLALLASLPSWTPGPPHAPLWGWLSLFVGVTATPILLRCTLAVAAAQGPDVQRAVKTCILSVIPLGAVMVLAAAGPGPAIAVAALLPPTMYLGRFIYST